MLHPSVLRRGPGSSRATAAALVALVALLLPALPATAATSPPAPAASPPSPAASSAERGRSAEALAKRADREGSLRLIAEIDTSRNGPAVAAAARSNGGTRTRVFDVLPYVALRGDGRTIRALARNPHVVAVTEDVAVPPNLASTLPVIGADDVQGLGWTGAGRTIAVLDTGIDADHPFFADNDGATGSSRIVSEACYSTPSNNTDEFSLCPGGVTASTAAGSADIDGNAQCAGIGSRCDHGTHVAGIAAGDGTGVAGSPGNGVAPDAGIIAIQVFTRFDAATDCNPNPAPCVLTYTSDQLAGLNRVAALDIANPGWNIVAANMSLGGGNNSSACDSDTRKTAVDTLLAAGVATVISSGNNSFLNAVGAPGCISTAVTVGNSADNDTVWPSSNRGPLLDIFAPGGNVTSAVVDDAWGGKNGTSMAAPHVAGAFAALGEAFPTRAVGDLLADMTSTGVAITYATDAAGTTTATTPRLALLAALQAPGQAPTLDADAAVVAVDEGSAASNTGGVTDPDGDPITAMSASVGSVTRTGDMWSWSWRPADGPAQSQVVTITATDDKGESGTTTFRLDVANVASTVTIDPSQQVVIDEGGSVTVSATFSDPGWLDTHTATIDWGVPAGHAGELVSPPALTLTTAGGPGVPRQGTVTGTYRYGDNDAGAGFSITVTVTDKDAGAGSGAVALTVRNVAPETGIDEAGAVLLDGVPTLVAHAGESVTIGAGATDPGSDDLTLAYSFGDGGTATHDSLVNPPTDDPSPSPTVQARDVAHSLSHVYSDACLYELGLGVTDDDGGSATDSLPVVITGNAALARSSGYWSTEYRAVRRSDFTPATLQCYVEIVRHVSAVFSEVRPLASPDDAAAVLNSRSSDADDIFDTQLLTAWLNFANGPYDLDELVDTDGNGIADRPFLEVLVDAETLRLDPSRARADVLAMKDVLERLNNP